MRGGFSPGDHHPTTQGVISPSGYGTTPLVVEALCHQKLGHPDAARRCLAVARELLLGRTEETDLHRGNYGYGTVVDEALRAVQPKE